MTTDAVYNKLSFNGYNVTFYNHETRMIEDKAFPTYQSVMDRGWEKGGDPFPDVEDFAEDLFNVYGDCVGKVTDNAGNVLLDNMDEMNELYDNVGNWP